MAFSFFTKRSRRPSTRLRMIARYLQFTAIISATALVGLLVARLFLKEVDTKLPLPLPLIITYVTAGVASLFVIARGLLRRERWAGYLAAFTFGAPLVRHVINYGADLFVGGALVPLAALVTIASVWKELGPVRDSDFLPDDDDDDYEPPKRKRGFGEPRSLPRESPPDFRGTTKAPPRVKTRDGSDSETLQNSGA